jgi:hypothetical protein
LLRLLLVVLVVGFVFGHEEYFLSDFPPDYEDKMHEHYAAVGKVAAIWATFELNIDQVIWRGLHAAQKPGACVTAQFIGPGPRFRALNALVGLYKGGDRFRKELNVIAQDAQQLAAKRNRVVHDHWTLNIKTGDPVRLNITADKVLDFAFKSMPTADVMKIHAEIKELNLRFIGLSENLRNVLSALPE